MSDPITIITIVGSSTSVLISGIKLIKILCDYKHKKRRRRDLRHLRIHVQNMATSQSTALSTELQGLITSIIDSIVTQWAGKRLNLTALFSIISQAKTLVESIEPTTSYSVQAIVTQAISDLLNNNTFLSEIDKLCTPSEIALLQEFLPYGISIVFSVGSDVRVEVGSCWSWFTHLFKKKALASQAQPRPSTT